jgi:imidazolonepropionase-like amidohydrolase
MPIMTKLHRLSRAVALCAGVALAPTAARAQQPIPSITVRGPLTALTHVRVIDGTGAAPRDDMTVIISGHLIRSVAPTGAPTPSGAEVLDLSGQTVIPGIIGMHDHLYYPSYIDSRGPVMNEMAYSFPRLYLAAGVTTIRTAGALAPDSDLRLKAMIDDGSLAGPRIYVTSPFLEGPSSQPMVHQLADAADAARTVEYWSSEGIHWFKAYQNITRAELEATIVTAHRLGGKVTGHLCSVGYLEAARLGIDNIEHGFLLDAEFDSSKVVDQCPRSAMTAFERSDTNARAFADVIHELVERHVAITSTLPVFEQYAAGAPPVPQRVLDAIFPESRESCLAQRKELVGATHTLRDALDKEMLLERRFVAAGGTLIAGPDPTGNGCVIAGFGDQREIELLVEAGFSPVQAIQIATLNGAKVLGADATIGSIAVGKEADIVVIQGNPAARIADIENVTLVFKAGIGRDPLKLLASIKGTVGQR